MVWGAIIAAAGQAVSSAASGYAQWEQGIAQFEASKRNALRLKRQAGQIREAGVEEADLFAQDLARYQSAQEASLAASGLQLGEGVAGALVDETHTMGRRDLATLLDNIDRQADTTMEQAEEVYRQGVQAKRMGNFALGTGLLGGSMNSAATYYSANGGSWSGQGSGGWAPQSTSAPSYTATPSAPYNRKYPQPW